MALGLSQRARVESECACPCSSSSSTSRQQTTRAHQECVESANGCAAMAPTPAGQACCPGRAAASIRCVGARQHGARNRRLLVGPLHAAAVEPIPCRSSPAD